MGSTTADGATVGNDVGTALDAELGDTVALLVTRAVALGSTGVGAGSTFTGDVVLSSSETLCAGCGWLLGTSEGTRLPPVPLSLK